MDNQQMDNKQMDNKQMDNKQMDNKQMDNKQMDNKQMDNKQMDNQQLLERIFTFSPAAAPPGGHQYSRVLLQLFGYNGHGKSSFINSCKYVMDGGDRFIEHAVAGHRSDEEIITTIRKAYELTKNISIVDNRGYNKMDGFQRAEVYAQL
ncbi:uncharacterized protein RB166_021295, partial [Leptodactylus fuscus]